MLTVFFLVVCLAVTYSFYKRWTRISISHIPGPESKSFLYGNLPELFQAQAGEIDFKWQQMYGDVIRIRAPLGEDRLLISDPKALQYIYHTASYRFPKPQSRVQISRLTFGPGITNVDGDDHKRHRKVMLPGFGGPESKSFFPTFFACAEKMAQRWKDSIEVSPDQSTVLDVSSWISRATLDAIGQAAFDYEFGALDDSDNVLAKAFDLFGVMTNRAILFLSVMDHLPSKIIPFLMKKFPSGRLDHALLVNRLSTAVAKELVDEKFNALLEGKGRRDVMSLLVKANASENAKTQLEERELLGQMNIIILAGHETTSNTLCFVLFEMCKQPEMQERLRREIRATERVIHDRGDTQFSPSDFDSMPYLSAVVKETLRFHPIAYNIYRVAAKDDVLPLSMPITTTSGKVLHELPIPKGLHIDASVAAYNRNKDIFGDDAGVFDPDRWLRNASPKTKTALGVYANLFTFASGSRSCIGWRFAVMELHAFMIELLSNFEFSFAEVQGIRREACGVMTPTIEGQVEKGSQLPLKIKLAQRDD
ncbi:cytochrome P450 [Guyanagaster necrorhizus]|uniref:Cytochrome P450 n=1 Tax=Guyanagaster necrorhizus TaxID=856835 RepID=A0A9P7VXP5_9AGAR|nr:cytochrome P450 [Guyanagaster necrorhizus MCA 3950]KAG7448645.1 cytochrome P450 [Guyanagaster necrorhizus MCA 3950]